MALASSLYSTNDDFTPLPVAPVDPVAPFNATANENFLLTVIPSTATGIVASQAFEIVAVVVNVIVTVALPLFETVAEIPVGQTISAAVTFTVPH
mgnify:CR=1 FL=1